MIKIKRISILLLSIILLTGAISAAAISALYFERDVTGGAVFADLDPNVAIRFLEAQDYESLINELPNGEVVIDLDKAINNSSSLGFNANALFAIGDNHQGAFGILNNSNTLVTVSFQGNNIELIPVKDDDFKIEPGKATWFFFRVDTTELKKGDTIKGVLTVQSTKVTELLERDID